MRAPFVAFLFLAVDLVACSGGSSRPATSATTVAGRPAGTPEPIKAQIVPTEDDSGGTAAEVFERARLAMSVGQHAQARVLFDRVAKAERAEHPDAPTSLGRAAAYNAALCSESLEESLDARDRFRALSLASPGTPDALDADLRRARLDVEIEDWADLGLASSTLLGTAGAVASSSLARSDRAEALALQALHMIHGAHDLGAAQKSLVQATKLLEQKDKPDEEPPPQNAAAVHFARGDLLRAQGDAIAFLDAKDPKTPIVSADFPVKLETRCQKILDAQDAYVDAINTRELRWAVRAGVRVATMYLDLHRDVTAIPPPKSATDDDKKQLFKGAMMLRYRILLEKGLGTLERTLNLETKAGAKSTWLQHAKQAKASVEKQLQDEKSALAKLPYTEEELKKALDLLAKKPAKA